MGAILLIADMFCVIVGVTVMVACNAIFVFPYLAMSSFFDGITRWFRGG